MKITRTKYFFSFVCSCGEGEWCDCTGEFDFYMCNLVIHNVFYGLPTLNYNNFISSLTTWMLLYVVVVGSILKECALSRRREKEVSCYDLTDARRARCMCFLLLSMHDYAVF